MKKFILLIGCFTISLIISLIGITLTHAKAQAQTQAQVISGAHITAILLVQCVWHKS